MSSALEIRNVSKRYECVNAVVGVNLTVDLGEIVGLIGTNGAGKTTLLDIIGGFILPDSGSVGILGRSTTGLQAYRVSRLGVARLFQEIRLARALSVYDNLVIAGNSRHESTGPLLTSAGICDERRTLAGSLSYGQQKVLALAMCVNAKPKLMLLDEPFAGLSPVLTEQVSSFLKDISGQGTAIVAVDHNVRVIAQTAVRVIAMSAGRFISCGSPTEVLAAPEVINSYLRPTSYV